MVAGSSVLDTLEIESVHHIDVKSQQIQCYQKTDLLTGMQHCMQQINPTRKNHNPESKNLICGVELDLTF